MSSRVSVALLRSKATVGAASPLPSADADLAAPVDLQRRGELGEPMAAARTVLCSLLGCRPEELSIRRAHNGKPELSGGELHFSVAEKGAQYAVVTSVTHPVGVEIVRMAAPPRVLLDVILPAHVRNEVMNAPALEQHWRFASWWARIEAAVKACAAGLDEVERCLALAPQRVAVLEPGLVIAVACRTNGPFDVHWPVGVQAPASLLEPPSDLGVGVAM